MKFTTATFFLALSAGSQAFQPLNVYRPRTTSTSLYDGNDPNIVDKAADAVKNAVDDVTGNVEDALDFDDTPLSGNGLSESEEEDMWQRQRELQANRNKHSGSKEQRQEKYSDEPIVENDKHDELKQPWTKSKGGDDHYSVNGKL